MNNIITTNKNNIKKDNQSDNLEKSQLPGHSDTEPLETTLHTFFGKGCQKENEKE